MSETEFRLTEDHIKLLREMGTEWNDVEYGAPSVNPKRPYGNSSVELDMARILGWDVPKDKDGDVDYDGAAWEEFYERCRKISFETVTALQLLLLNAGSPLAPGLYRRENPYDRRGWKRKGD